MARTMRDEIMIVYRKLWEKMKEAGITQYRLQKEGFSNSTITRSIQVAERRIQQFYDHKVKERSDSQHGDNRQIMPVTSV